MRNRQHLFSLLINIVIVAAIIIYVSISINQLATTAENEAVKRLESSLENAAVSCFSIEGFYPVDVDYLIDNYGIVVDEDKYHVFYESYGTNLKPEIRIIRKAN